MQQITKKMLIVCCVLAGISACCMAPGRSLERKNIADLIKRNKKNYIPYVKSLAYQWSWYHSLGSFARFAAKKLAGYTESELKYADAAGVFFENQARVEKEARAIGTKNYDIDYMHNLLKRYEQQGSNPKKLPKILHESNIESLSLPTNVTQSMLQKDPGKLSKLVKTGQINAPRYYRNVALNIFLRFLVEKKLLP